MKHPSVGIAVITHRAKHHLPKCLPPLLKSPLKPRVLVVNSSSHDGTVELAQELGAETLVIPRKEFNHGATRELARKHLGTEIIVMITPDAYAVDHSVVEKLIHPLANGHASVAYARQLPHDGATFFEAFARNFNYPREGHIRSFQDVPHFGVYSIFCSNSCAAYLNRALDEVNGFPTVLLGEDTFTVARLLEKGHRIAYTPEAQIKHSHSYNLVQEFKRNFDTGIAREQHKDIIAKYGKDEKRGRTYVKEMGKQLWKEKPHLLPFAALRILICWLGYKVGKASLKAPLWWKKLCTSQDFYWTSDHYKKKT